MAISSLTRFFTLIVNFTFNRHLNQSLLYHQLLERRDFPSKQLFLFSRADTMISSTDVERFASRQRSRGVNVLQKCWPDSPHVLHLRHYASEYTQLCLSFLSKCVLSAQEEEKRSLKNAL